jgi:predicted RNA binding protein YcfA (HicA-like mRNA interferase family)
MPKLPIIKAKELIKALKKLGFLEHRQVGSHLVIKHDDSRRTVIPVHSGQDIPRGTLKAILRDIEVSVDELIGVL